MSAKAYVRFPSIRGDEIVFCAEDDLWRLPTGGGSAERLTATAGAASQPAISPDGASIAYVDRSEGPAEVYLLDRGAGASRRLTYEAGRAQVLGWSPDGAEIYYASSRGQSSPRMRALFALPAGGGEPRPLPYGMANGIAHGPKGVIVLGRNLREPAYWKRYRGGTAGFFWIDREGRGEFERFLDLKGNLTSPCWAGGRFFFISDHEGTGAVYSCDAAGGGLERHSPLGGFYARNLRSDGARLAFHAGGELFIVDPRRGSCEAVEVRLPGSREQLARRFVPAGRYIDSWDLHPKGHMIALADRGKAFTFGTWEGAVVQHGALEGARYRFLRWLSDGRRLAAIRDDGGEPRIVVLDPAGSEETVLEGIELGQVLELAASPAGDRLLAANQRGEILLLDLAAGTRAVLDRSEYGSIEDSVAMSGIAWSPDGRYAAYSFALDSRRAVIKVAEVETGLAWQVTEAVGRDYSPSFDPGGRYLYFISARCYDPVQDVQTFDMGFPRGTRPYLVTLAAETLSPFSPAPEPDTEKDKDADGKKAEAPKPIAIDFEGIALRVRPFPLPEGRYARIVGIAEGAAISSSPIEGTRDFDFFGTAAPAKLQLERYDFKARKAERIAEGLTDFSAAPDGARILYRSGERLRLIKSDEKALSGDGPPPEDKPGRDSGWIDLGRVKVSIRPALEWKQMLGEAWRLQREQFWAEDMSGIDWEGARLRYESLLERITSRDELSDLIWELQGELGTSHAYEFGGDYRPGPKYDQGFLGADWRADGKGWAIARLVRGDPWDDKASSALLAPGARVAVGDRLLAVNGRPLSARTGPQELLANQAGREVELLVEPAGGGEPRRVTVRAQAEEYGARYRDWVEANRAAVHAASKGRLGYLHVPDMDSQGFAEFHRYFPAERDREGLIVDVRWNGGGNVSGLLLEKLARRRVGYSFARWSKPEAYPFESPRGPMVALTDENAGSDGDIFCHAFKLMKLGPLVGKRTWGGVVGISPRVALADGSLTTQPEFSFWFKDVKWGVENYGTDPDIDVDYRPQDYAAGRDPQLERAIEVALALVADEGEAVPEPLDRPRLGLTRG